MTARLFRHLADLLFGGLVVGSLAQCCQAQPRLRDGVISYTTGDGQRKAIDVGRKCTDLWVAPDESVFAFVAIEASLPPDPNDLDREPFITASSIYIARRSGGFAPVRLDVGTIRAYGRDWNVFRNPRVAPGAASVLFGVPVSITSDEVFAYDLKTGRNTDIGGAAEWCVEWGGPHSGSILMKRRYISDSVIKHRCYVWSGPGDEKALADECEHFGELASAWSHNNGGSCR
jgi:hypothetical protein